jgi:hypothetical protein
VPLTTMGLVRRGGVIAVAFVVLLTVIGTVGTAFGKEIGLQALPACPPNANLSTTWTGNIPALYGFYKASGGCTK